MINPIYLDDRGGNMLPSSKQRTSENPSTCNATYYFLKEESGDWTEKDENMIAWLNYQKWSTNGGRYMTNSFDILQIDYAKKNNLRSPDRFSLDEAISVAATSRRYGHYANLKKIELFSRSYSLRPDTFAYLLCCKHSVFNYLLVPRLIVSLSMIIACMSEKGSTSGKQLAYIRYKGLNMNWTWKICNMALTNKNFAEVFSIYYPEENHPINKLARLLWAK